MAHGQVTTKVPAELKSAAVGGVVASAEGIFDYNENKTQEQLNQDLKKAIEDIDVTEQINGKLDKTEADELYQPKGNYLTEHQDISGKANVTDVYTKQQVDAALGDKQDILADSEDVVKVIKENSVALNFTNKTYNSATFSGLGRIYLRKNIVTLEGVEKNVLTQAMVNTANTIYHIQYDYDLNGQTITLPAGCVLEFDGGSLANGTIIGTNTVIDGKPLFKEITFDGSYVCKHVSSKDFEYATNDDGLTAVFQLLNCIKKDVVCELEAKTYDIDYKSSVSGNNLFSKWKLDNCSNITINGNGAVLNHTNPLTDIPQGSSQLNSILKLNSCTYITIKELTYQNLNGYETNYQGDCDGICVIFFEGDNRFLDISMTVKNARSSLGNHIYAPAQTNHIGLVSDSVFNVKQYNTGYGVTFSWIANSKINVESHGQHRGIYLTGASNCDVYLEWEDQWTAPIACLIGNSWTGGSDNLVWHTCRDLNIVSICTQETANANDATVAKYCAGLISSEEPRTIGLTMQNITITTGSLHGLSNGFISALSTSPSTDTTVKDYYKNFTFTINNIYSRFEFHDNRVIQDFTIVNSRISGGIYADFIKSSKLIFRDSYLKSARIGKGTYNFINTDIGELMDYDSKSSKTDTLIYFDNCFITSTSNLTIKATIISSMLPYNQTYFWPFSVLYSGTNCDVSRVIMPNYRANALNYGKLLIQTSNNGGSANRPSNAENLKVGVMYFDTTLKKPIWWDGTQWVDATGTAV